MSEAVIKCYKEWCLETQGVEINNIISDDEDTIKFAEHYHKQETERNMPSGYKEKLKTLMVNLEIQYVDEFMKSTNVDNY